MSYDSGDDICNLNTQESRQEDHESQANQTMKTPISKQTKATRRKTFTL